MPLTMTQKMQSSVAQFTLTAQAKPWRRVAAVVTLHAVIFAAFFSGWGADFVQPAPVLVWAKLVAEPTSARQILPSEELSQKALAIEQPVHRDQTEPQAKLVDRVDAVVQTASQVQPVTSVVEVDSNASPIMQSEVKPSLPPPVIAVARIPATLQASGTCSKPEYPAISRRKEEEGTVLLKFLIGAQGQVLESLVEKSSGFARLDEAARLALAQCQFKPGSVDGKPESSWAQVKYTWRLN